MKSFSFQRASSVEEAISSVIGTGGKYLAGGTNLIDLMKDNVENPPALIDIRKLDLKQIYATPPGGVMIQSGVSNSAIANHTLIRTQYPVISQAILSGANDTASQYGNCRRQSSPAYALSVFHGNRL